MFDDLVTALAHIEGFERGNLVRRCRFLRDEKRRVFFIGNGGSAAIAGHMAVDWLKAGGFAAMCFNDGAALTCITNDLGYENVFRVPLELHARPGDMLFAMSSSGRSTNIILAAAWAASSGVFTVTLSGFKPNNQLRETGNENIYVPSTSYGTVEIAHLAILHAVLDDLREG